MNWEKCMKKMNCKVCEDNQKCNDDDEIKEKKKRKPKTQKKKQ